VCTEIGTDQIELRLAHIGAAAMPDEHDQHDIVLRRALAQVGNRRPHVLARRLPRARELLFR
jgi:hypothetical protein